MQKANSQFSKVAEHIKSATKILITAGAGAYLKPPQSLLF